MQAVGEQVVTDTSLDGEAKGSQTGGKISVTWEGGGAARAWLEVGQNSRQSWRAEDFPREDSKYQGGELPPWLQQTLLGLWWAREGGQRENGNARSWRAMNLQEKVELCPIGTGLRTHSGY